MAFPHFKQAEQMDCGPTCLRIIAKYYGKDVDADELRRLSSTTRNGSSFLGLSKAAEKIGFKSVGIKLPFNRLLKDITFPCIAHWNQSHYLVIYKVKNKKVYVSDPAHRLIMLEESEFLTGWADENNTGLLLLLEPSRDFVPAKDTSEKTRSGAGWGFVHRYLYQHRKQAAFLVACMIAASLLQLIFPFLTQNIIDVGIKKKDIHFIYLILFAQLMVFAGRTTVDIIRTQLLVRLGNAINVALVSEFFAKLMRLPISFFDVKMTGDILQRINDHKRIETFLTTSSLNTLFSVFNLLIFGSILWIYNWKVFSLFAIGSAFYFIWVLFFLKKRADIDYRMFQQLAKNQSKELELINGMQEVKLNNAEQYKLSQWNKLQIKLFEVTRKSFTVSQIQNSGAAFINELKNIFITVLSASLVLNNQLTLGMMLSISYIIGQLNLPVLDLVNFIQRWQDAKLSLERIGEIHNRADEETAISNNLIIRDSSISIRNVTFKYDNFQDRNTLDDLSVEIPSKKITAIVGTSGSGKTTLLKLLLKFYEPVSGSIFVDKEDLLHLKASKWRSNIGVVMQEGFIFSDTIANNIAVGEQMVDKERLEKAAFIANIREFVESLPLGFNTRIGNEGTGLSTGQKQRILIARAVYKDPAFLFFDEATSALDANNEKIIMNNLNMFFKGRTVVIIAHRLSTVKNADQILVLDKGKVIETGTHEKLTSQKGTYYELVKDQLELGN
jgi:ATP-binding cassette subfamily B protein